MALIVHLKLIFILLAHANLPTENGVQNPIMLRDAEFGPIRLRAFGSYCFKIQDDASIFFKTIAGTNPEFRTEDIEDQLRNLILTRFTDFYESKIPAGFSCQLQRTFARYYIL